MTTVSSVDSSLSVEFLLPTLDRDPERDKSSASSDKLFPIPRPFQGSESLSR
jgi:hypothetical protein